MNFPCTHWSDGNVTGGGLCALNLFGGRPSIGTCALRCEQSAGDPVELTVARKKLNDKIAVDAQRALAKNDCGCKKTTIHRWLGIRWIGLPWPKRWHWNPYQTEFEYWDSPGCGCILKMKRLTEYAKLWWKV